MRLPLALAGDMLLSWLALGLDVACQVECYGARLESELKRLTECFILWGLYLHSSVKIKDQAKLFSVRWLGKNLQNYGFSILLQL